MSENYVGITKILLNNKKKKMVMSARLLYMKMGS